MLLLQGCFNIQNMIPCSCRRSCFWQGLFWRLSKKKREDSSCLPFVIFSMLWSWFSTLCHASSNTICSKNKNLDFYNSFPTFWGKKWNLLFTVTIHLSLFTVTIHYHYSLLLFTSNFCLFKGGCPLYLKQVLSVFSSELLPKREFSLMSLSLRDLLAYYNLWALQGDL